MAFLVKLLHVLDRPSVTELYPNSQIYFWGAVFHVSHAGLKFSLYLRINSSLTTGIISMLSPSQFICDSWGSNPRLCVC